MGDQRVSLVIAGGQWNVVTALVILGSVRTARGMLRPRPRVARLLRPLHGGRGVIVNDWGGCDEAVEMEVVLFKFFWMGSGGRYGALRGVLTVVGFRDGEDSVISALKPIGAIIVLRSVGERWSFLVCCVGGVVSFGGVQAI